MYRIQFLKAAAVTLLLPLLSLSASAEECLKMGTTPSKSTNTVDFTTDVKKVFETAGLCLKKIEMPARRIRQAMMDGELDGEYFRIKPYIKAMQDHVVHLPTPIVSGKVIMVSLKSSGFTPDGLKDIGDKKVAVPLGSRWGQMLSKKIKNFRPEKKTLNSVKQLSLGRIDAFFTYDVTVKHFIAKGLLKGDDVHISKPVFDLSAFILLHKKNNSLTSKLDEAVKRVKAAGGFGAGQRRQ